MTKAERDKPQTTSKAKSRIPSFKTIDEEATFWDSHSLTEFADELEEVSDVKFVRPRPKKGMTLRLEPETLATLSGIARAKGIGPSTLARMWILERLRQSDQAANAYTRGPDYYAKLLTPQAKAGPARSRSHRSKQRR